MSLSFEQSLLGRLHLHALAVVCTHFGFVDIDDVRFNVFLLKVQSILQSILHVQNRKCRIESSKCLFCTEE